MRPTHGTDAATPLAEARALLRERTHPLAETERLPLGEAGGRFLAAPLPVPRDVPAADNAAVDGWAFAWTPAIGRDGATLAIAAERSAAGRPATMPLRPGEAMRVLTGAVVPEGADSVAPDETCRLEGRTIRLSPGLAAGANRRRAGEDLEAGTAVLARGDRLDARRIGLAALTGAAEVEVFRRLRVGVLSTGDELLAPGEPFRPGGVQDANRPMLQALLASLPVEPVDLGIVRDEPASVEAALAAAADRLDAIVTTGGASVGDADHVVAAIRRLGRLDLWRVAMKPGRPVAFGRIGRAVVIALSGNPAAAFVGWALLARPVLVRLGGGAWPEHAGLPAEAAFELDKPAGRSELARATLDRSGERPRVRLVGRQGSGVLSALVEADGLVELPPEVTAVRRGDLVTFHGFAELLA